MDSAVRAMRGKEGGEEVEGGRGGGGDIERKGKELEWRGWEVGGGRGMEKSEGSSRKKRM